MKAWLLFPIALPIFLCQAQDFPRADIDLTKHIEEVFSVQDMDLPYEELYENLAQLLANPIDLNRVSADDLRNLFLLNEADIQAILNHRLELGEFLSVYELQSIPGIDAEVIYTLMPFIRVSDQSTSFRNIIGRIVNEKNNYFLVRCERALEPKRGFGADTDSSARFKGSQDKIYLRFRTSKPGDFSLGFTTEKDAGEKITWSPTTKQFGFDYWSAHMQVSNKGLLKNLIVGDFQSQFGQGLILGGAFGTGKGAETVTGVRRSSVGFVPYSSANEASFYRGVGATLQIARHFFVSGFASQLHRDATVSEDSSGVISSFQLAGLHRNANELAGRKASIERNIGSVFSVRKKNSEAGFVIHAISFSYPVLKKETPYNQFAFQGEENTNFGAYLNFNYNNFTFFGEVAKTRSAGAGIVAGTIGSLGKNVDVSLLYRNYGRDFHTFTSNAFAEGSPQNESGIYWGWKYKLTRKYNLAGYVDIFGFPWLRFRSYVPSTGHEWLLRVNFQPTRSVLAFVQCREEVKVRNIAADHTNQYQTSEGKKRNYWISVESSVSQKLKLKTRAQFSTFSINSSFTRGFVLLQDISWKLGKAELTGRYALFDTEDFDNRQYVFENDVWLAYSLQAYNGTGLRTYIVAEYNFSKKLCIWLRYALVRYNNIESIGSGVEAIAGNERNDVKFQVRIKL